MSKRANFTKERLDGFKCRPGKKQDIYWDGKVPGLGLRVTAAGARSYIFETRLHGKTVRLTIGKERAWKIGEAQAEARRLRVLTDRGIDPRELAAQQKAKAEEAKAKAKRNRVTLGDVWQDYLAYGRAKLNRRTGKQGWSDTHYRDHVRLAAPGGEIKIRGKGRTIAGPLAPLMDLPLAELTADRIADWLGRESKTRPTSTAKAYRLLRAFILWAQDDYPALIPANAHSAKKVKDAVPIVQAKEGDVLQREQLPAWFSAVRSIGNPVIAAYLQTLLITGGRREEIAALRWNDVDFQWRSLKIHDKVEGSRTIPLTPYVAALLADLKRRNQTPPPKYRILHGKRVENDIEAWKPSEWVFSSPTAKATGGRLTEPSIAHNGALAASGLPHVTLHGLRRSFGTLAEWLECPAGVVAQIQGHAPSAIAEKHYRRRPLDLLRMWHDKIEAWILEQAGVEFKQAPQRLQTVK